MQDFLYEGQALYSDNFYASYELATYLLEIETHVVGTLRAREKNMPKEVLEPKLKKGDVIAWEDEKLVIIFKWKDVRHVRLLSTMHASYLVNIE